MIIRKRSLARSGVLAVAPGDPDSKAATPGRVRGLKIAGAALVLAVTLACTLVSWQRQQENFNPGGLSVLSADQIAVVVQARMLIQSSDRIALDRQRGPLLAGLMAMSGSDSDMHLFDIGIRINQVLCVLGVLVLAVVTARRAGWLSGLVVAVILLSGVTAYFGAWLRADLLASILLTGVLLLCWRVLERPHLALAALLGLLMGVTYLAKPVILPILACYILALGASVARARFWPPSEGGRGDSYLACGAITVVCLAAVIAPYMSNSARQYGSPTYNVNTTYYLWYDTFEESQAVGTGAHYDRVGAADMPEDELPSLGRYLSTHSVSDIWNRLVEGGLAPVRLTAPEAQPDLRYLTFPILALALGAASVVVFRRRLFSRLVSSDPVPYAFMATSILLLMGATAWWLPFSSGMRFLLPWLLPVVVLSVMTLARGLQDLEIDIGPRRAPAASVSLSALVFLALANGAWIAISVSTFISGGA